MTEFKKLTCPNPTSARAETTLMVSDRKICWNVGKSKVVKLHATGIKRCYFLGASVYKHHLLSLKHIASQVMISLTSQSKLGYAKYNMRNDGRANRTVTSMYRANMAALAGIAYRMIKSNITTNGNLAVK